MDARENSKVLKHHFTFDKQEQDTSPSLSYPSINLFTPNTNIHSSNLYPMFTTMEFNVPENARTNKDNSNFFVSCGASSGYFDVPPEEESFVNSDSDSTSEVGGDESDEEANLEKLLHDGEAKKKIEQLAAIVGVDTTEPVAVLTEVVKVLKHFKRINQYHIPT